MVVVGWRRELDALNAGLQRALAGRGSVVLLEGHYGLGKFRLCCTWLIGGGRLHALRVGEDQDLFLGEEEPLGAGVVADVAARGPRGQPLARAPPAHTPPPR